jgi:hypothetical protein
MTGLEAHNLMMCDNKIVRKENSLFKIENDRLWIREVGKDDWKPLDHIGDIYGFYLCDGYEVYEDMLNIEVGKLYKTRCGYKAKIYSVENNLFGNIHGAFLLPEYNLWESHEWSSNGWICHPEESPEDLVSEWTEPEEENWQESWESENKPVVKDGFWEKYPDAKWIAMDVDGDWYTYNTPACDGDDWHSPVLMIDKEDCPKFSGNPEDSLLIRPDGV